MKAGKTQCQRILEYMKEHGSITAKEAMDEIGCMRLGSRIFDLKEEGYCIRAEMESSKNRFGETTYYSRYYLVDTTEDEANV